MGSKLGEKFQIRVATNGVLKITDTSENPAQFMPVYSAESYEAAQALIVLTAKFHKTEKVYFIPNFGGDFDALEALGNEFAEMDKKYLTRCSDNEIL